MLDLAFIYIYKGGGGGGLAHLSTIVISLILLYNPNTRVVSY